MGVSAADKGSTVTLRYSIILEDGQQVDAQSTRPLTFTIGEGKVLEPLEQGVIGMSVNEVRDITIGPEQGYGVYNDDLILQVDREAFPEDLKLVPGRTIQYQNRDGERANFMVREVSGDRVTLDGNHPLAGQTLIYRVELLELG